MPKSRSLGAALTVGLAAVVVVVAALLFSGGDVVPIGTRSSGAAPIERTYPSFPGASGSRIFLTRAESREATTRGLIPAGTQSILVTDGKMTYGQWKWDDAGVPTGPVTIKADLDRQMISAFVGPHEVGTAVIVYGANGKETPRGRLPILGKTRDYHSITYDAAMPYSLWLRRDGVAIHGSTVTAGHATNGCIGVPEDFAKRLFAIASKGDIVEVSGGPGAG